MTARPAARLPVCAWFGLMLVVSLLAGCSPGSDGESESDLNAGDAAQVDGHVVWVDSYNSAYAWSANIEEGIEEILDPSGVKLTVFRMDTKQITDESRRVATGLEIAAAIAAIDPDVVIVTDDNAQRYLVVPHLLETSTPVVFAGVNWDASEYGYPASNVTGMIEIDLVEQLVELLRPYAAGEERCIVSGDTVTDHKLNATYNERFFDGSLSTSYATTWPEFQSAFLALQQTCDMVLIGNNAGIVGWDEAVAESWIRENTVVVTGSPQAWVSPYVLISLSGLGEEQGNWAAERALEIIAGRDIASIPMAENRRGQLTVNLAMADSLRVAVQPAILRTATIYDPGEDTDD